MPGTLKLNSGGAGNLILTPSGSVGSDVTVTIPAVSGTVQVQNNMPAFSAYNTADVNLSSDVWTKITFNVEVFDTNSCYDTSNYRFTPNVAGYYLISANSWVTWSGATPRSMGTAIYKNGSRYAQTKMLTASGSSLYGNSPVTAVIYLNGSTDYVEAYATCVLGTTVYVNGNDATLSYWSGTFVRGA